MYIYLVEDYTRLREQTPIAAFTRKYLLVEWLKRKLPTELVLLGIKRIQCNLDATRNTKSQKVVELGIEELLSI